MGSGSLAHFNATAFSCKRLAFSFLSRLRCVRYTYELSMQQLLWHVKNEFLFRCLSLSLSPLQTHTLSPLLSYSHARSDRPTGKHKQSSTNNLRQKGRKEGRQKERAVPPMPPFLSAGSLTHTHRESDRSSKIHGKTSLAGAYCLLHP